MRFKDHSGDTMDRTWEHLALVFPDERIPQSYLPNLKVDGLCVQDLRSMLSFSLARANVSLHKHLGQHLLLLLLAGWGQTRSTS